MNDVRMRVTQLAMAALAAAVFGEGASAREASSARVPLALVLAPAAPIKGSGVNLIHEVVPARTPEGARVILRLSGVTDRAGATVRYTLQGAGRIVSQDAAPLPSGQESVREVRVAFDPTQRVYLNVFTRQGDRAGVVAVPLGATPARVPPSGEARKGAAAQPMVVLPAQTR